MSAIWSGVDVEEDLSAARDGDDAAFERLVAPLRGELHAHCYRMLGSAHDADDALQEALLRAWRHLARLERGGALRSWLYTVATRTCLDAVTGRSRRALPMDLGPASESARTDDAARDDVPWLTPYGGADAAGVPRGAAVPHARYEQREAVELAFVAACQHLPPNQRAALLLFDVLGFSAAEIAEMTGTTSASVNSALQRARRTVAERVPQRSQQRTLRTLDDARLRAVVADYAAAFERGDVAGLAALLTADVTWSMPPLPGWYSGLAAAREFAAAVPMRLCGAWRHLPTGANGQRAVASYLRRPGAPDTVHAAWSIDVLTLREDGIAGITSFIGPEHFVRLGLPLQQ